ncbi:hypothetical protein B0H19DRAFT_1060525 [Mycena capillaripes]|nr:hypothetical protein B0H19DRAFT_1060525 [Mycena capillaripes]
MVKTPAFWTASFEATEADGSCAAIQSSLDGGSERGGRGSVGRSITAKDAWTIEFLRLLVPWARRGRKLKERGINKLSCEWKVSLWIHRTAEKVNSLRARLAAIPAQRDISSNRTARANDSHTERGCPARRSLDDVPWIHRKTRYRPRLIAGLQNWMVQVNGMNDVHTLEGRCQIQRSLGALQNELGWARIPTEALVINGHVRKNEERWEDHARSSSKPIRRQSTSVGRRQGSRGRVLATPHKPAEFEISTIPAPWWVIAGRWRFWAQLIGLGSGVKYRRPNQPSEVVYEIKFPSCPGAEDAQWHGEWHESTFKELWHDGRKGHKGRTPDREKSRLQDDWVHRNSTSSEESESTRFFAVVPRTRHIFCQIRGHEAWFEDASVLRGHSHD